MNFDRFDICEAYYVFAVDFHVNGVCFRKSRRDIFSQLNRMEFKPAHSVKELRYNGLTDNGKEIYMSLRRQYD